MRWVVRLYVCAALVLTGVFGVCSTAAADAPEAGGQCKYVNPRTGTCDIWIKVPGTPEVIDGGGGNAVGAGASGRASSDDPPPRENDEGTPACLKGDEPVPCTSDHGYWRQDVQCYINPTPLSPQPEEGSAVWQHFEEMFDRGPDTGAVYPCFDAAGEQVSLVYSPDAPAAGPPPPTPGEVARRAVAQMNLQAVQIGIAPQPPATAVAGVPVWFWVDDPGATTFGPATESATVRGVTVTATARVDKVHWNLGDGTTISCGVGTPYTPEYGGDPSPDCGHTFTRESGFEPDGAYAVTATTTWVVEWAGAGQSGTITLDPLVAQTSIVVAEGQVLVS